jgi:pimeloyl-ACP methyl ester carboxylesterase
VTLAYDDAGSGPAVLLLHSTVCDRRMWDPQMPALVDAGYRAVRCDLPGYGDSSVPDEPFDEAQNVVDLLDELGLDAVAVVGASGGGRVAQAVAARWPARVAVLALLCTAAADHEPGPELRAFGEREEALIEAGDLAGAVELNLDTWLGPLTDTATREKVATMQRRAFEVQLAAPPSAEVLDPSYDLAAIAAPTLIVSGAYDLADFRGIAADLADRLPAAELIELDWAGHLPSLERPDAVNGILVDFLRNALSP